jgi:hypothetical protein
MNERAIREIKTLLKTLNEGFIKLKKTKSLQKRNTIFSTLVIASNQIQVLANTNPNEFLGIIEVNRADYPEIFSQANSLIDIDSLAH